jgi:hypothetical protein
MAASLPRTSEGKVVLYEVSTGRRLLRWPVDARGFLASGAFSLDPADCQAPADLPAPPPPPAELDPVPHVTESKRETPSLVVSKRAPKHHT